VLLYCGDRVVRDKLCATFSVVASCHGSRSPILAQGGQTDRGDSRGDSREGWSVVQSTGTHA